MEIPDTHMKTTKETPRIIQRTKEVSREEVIISTRQFFAAVDRRNMNITTGAPTDIIADIHEREAIEVPDVSTTTPAVLDVEPRGTSSPRISLPEGSLSHPTVTATCRPRTWMQQLTEGQTNEHPRDEDSSESNDSTETNMIPEEIPDELGREWRVLHPFELPGVRNPTDSTPPNQRRLAENDALVELIQTTEYLDDVPTWGQRDYRLYPPCYGDPFYRGRGRGRHEWLQERQMDRPNRVIGRGFSCDNGENGYEVQPIRTKRTQSNRPEDDWSTPAALERKESDIERCKSPRAPPPPPVPPPTEERLFTDWSNTGSPRERITQHDGVPRNPETNINQTENQTEQHGPEPTRGEIRGTTLGDNVTLSSNHQQPSQEGTRSNDREVTRSDIEVRIQREGSGRNNVSNDEVRNAPIPTSSSGSHENEILIRSSPIRTIPQLDGPASIRTTGRTIEDIRTEPEITQ